MNSTTWALLGLGIGLVVAHLAVVILLRRLTQATKMIEYRRRETDLTMFLLEHTENRLKQTQECADALFKALHKTSYYCDIEHFDETQVNGAFELYREVRERNAHIG